MRANVKPTPAALYTGASGEIPQVCLGLQRDCQAGDWVSIHWDWACVKLTPAQVQNLDKYTRYHLTLANQTR